MAKYSYSTSMSPVFIYLCFTIVLLLLADSTSTERCTYSKSFGLFSADCADKNYEDVPSKELRSDIEVLDLTNNDIHELHNDTFQCCTKIKILYLGNNRIDEIESHAFEPLTRLETLDLSGNFFTELPAVLPSSIIRLYLGGNKNMCNKVLPLSKFTSLQSVSLSKCKTMDHFPGFDGAMPSLLELNLTDNPLKQLTPPDLAPLCRLEVLYISDRALRFNERDRICDCLKLEQWTYRHIKQVHGFKCNVNVTPVGCNTTTDNTTLAKYESCMTEWRNRKITNWLMTGGGIALAVAALFVVFFYVRRCKRQKRARLHSSNGAIPAANCKTEPDSVAMQANNERAAMEEDKLLKK